MNILFQCNELPPASSGGIGIFTLKTAQYLSNSGNKVYVIGLYDGKYEDNHIFKVIRIRRIRKLGFCGLIINSLIFQLYCFYFIYFKKNRVDVIEYPDYEGYAAFHFFKIPHIVRLHDSTFYSKNKKTIHKKLKWWLQYIAIRRAKYVVGVSNYSFNKIRNIVNFPYGEVIYNYFETKPAKGLKEAFPQKFILTVGSVNIQKGSLLLIESFIQFLKFNKDYDLIFIGRVNDDTILKYYNNLNSYYKSKIYLLGSVPHESVKEFIYSSSFLVFPSYNEAFSLAIIEAMSFSKIVASSDIPVTFEVITDNVNGFIFSLNKDDICKTIFKIVYLDPIRKKEIENNAKKSVNEKFSKESSMYKNIKMWNKVTTWR